MAHRNKSSMDYVSLSCCALAFVLYVNTLSAGFVYDDRRAILSNPDILGSTPWYNMLRNDFWGTPLHDSGSHGSYRPLCVVSFKLNHMFGGFKPVGYHLVNVLLHCLATGLVVKLARHLLPRGWGPAIAGTLFAVHPIHTEAVAGVVGRADLTACNFYLLTFLLYIKHVNWREKGDLNQWLALGGTILLSVAAVLCKETAVTALVVCALYDSIKGLSGYRDKHRVRSLTVLGLSLLIMLHLRLSLPTPATQFSTADNPTAKTNSVWTRFLTFTYLPVFNFNLLLSPTTLSFDWGMDAIPRITTIFDGRNFCSLLFYVTLARTIWKNVNILRNKNKTNIKSMLCHKISRLTTKKKYYQQQYQHLNSHQQQMHLQQQQQQHHEHHQNLSYNNKSSIVKFHHSNHNDSNNNNNCINKNNNYANSSSSSSGSSSNNNNNNNNNNIINDNNNDEHELLQDMVCKICKHGISLRHLSSCRVSNNNNNNNSNNNNNVPVSSVTSVTSSLSLSSSSSFLQPCGCPQFKFINKNLSLSPFHNNNNNNTNFDNYNSKIITRNNGGALSKPKNLGYPYNNSNIDYSFATNNCGLTNNNRINGGSVKTYKSIMRKPINSGVTNSFCDKFFQSDNFNSCNNNYNSNPASAILLSIIILTLPFLPAANIFFYVGFVVAERILYLPSVGYCLLIGLGLGKLMDPCRGPLKNDEKNRKIVLTFMCFILIILSVKTFQRNFDWKNEENLYKSARWINPPKALGNLGSVLSSQGRHEEAKQALLEALKYRPNMADVHYNLGVLLQNQQDFKAAVESFQRAVHFRPSLAVAYLNMGASLIALGRCREAAAILREGSKLDGNGLRDRTAHENAKISALLQLANLYADQEKLQRAIAIYREALHVLPERYPPQGIYHRLGDIFARLQQWSEAERFQRAAIEAQPDHIGAHISYGTMLAKNTSRSTEAEQWFKRAIRLAPTDASVHHHYAEFLTMMSREEEACDHRIKAAELSSKDYSLVVSAATALRLLDKKEEAETWYRQAVHLRPTDARAHTNLGAILHLMGKAHQAIASYKEALKLQPGDPTTMANLAKLGVFEIS